ILINNIDYNGNYNDVINILIPKENRNKFLDYDWKYISENIDIIKENYDINLVFKIPEELTDSESTCLYNKYKEEIVECGIKYYKKTNESQTTNSILISVAKNEYPFRGNNFPKEGNENISISKINETSIIILHSKIRMLYTESPQNYDIYVSRFKKDNIYYDIETIGISQKELISTLESIVDSN
ncbi:MAG: hypothetical protein PHX62_07930, partial [Bacilli bacterium]|nr:hypothetical protein [Bacilli bacterium]